MRLLSHKNRLSQLVPVLLGVLFACGDEVGRNDGFLYLSKPVLFAKMVFYVALFLYVFSFCERAIGTIARDLHGAKHSKDAPSGPFTRVFLFECNAKELFKGGLFIAVLWAPYIVALFPGVYWSDTSLQLLIHYGARPFTDHHPFFTTLTFGLMADIGRVLFDNAVYGLYVLVAMQLVASIALFSYVTIYLHELGVSRRGSAVVLLFFALFPVFPVMFSSLAKDTLSVLFFIPLTMIILRGFRTAGKSLEDPRNVVLMVLFAILTCLTKKAMVYVVTPSLVCLLVGKLSARGKVIGVASGLAVFALISVIIPRLVFPVLSIEPGGKQESIPFAIQQVAHDVKFNEEELSPEDKELISSFLTIDYEDISGAYDWQIADPVKGTEVKDPSLAGDFIKLWAKMWLRAPMGHFESWIGLVQGWLSFTNGGGTPGYLVVCTESAWYYEPIFSYVPEWPLTALQSDAARALYNTEQGLPVLNVVFFRAVWATVLPCFLLYCVLLAEGKRFQLFLSIVPVAMTFLYLMLVPVSGMGGEPTRYVFQLICTLPLFFGHVLIVRLESQLASSQNEKGVF